MRHTSGAAKHFLEVIAPISLLPNDKLSLQHSKLRMQTNQDAPLIIRLSFLDIIAISSYVHHH